MRKLLHPLSILITASLFLGACGSTNTQKPVPQTNLPSLEATPAPASVVEIPEALKEEDIETAAVEPDPTPIEVDDNPQQFLGLNIHEVSKLLGAPKLVRRDGSAEVWQYQAETCTLDLFLYEKEAGLLVKYIDLRGLGNNAENRSCMADILRRHLSQTS